MCVEDVLYYGDRIHVMLHYSSVICPEYHRYLLGVYTISPLTV